MLLYGVWGKKNEKYNWNNIIINSGVYNRMFEIIGGVICWFLGCLVIYIGILAAFPEMNE